MEGNEVIAKEVPGDDEEERDGGVTLLNLRLLIRRMSAAFLSSPVSPTTAWPRIRTTANLK